MSFCSRILNIFVCLHVFSESITGLAQLLEFRGAVETTVPSLYEWMEKNSYICEMGSASTRFLGDAEAVQFDCEAKCGDPLETLRACARHSDSSNPPECEAVPDLCIREFIQEFILLIRHNRIGLIQRAFQNDNNVFLPIDRQSTQSVSDTSTLSSTTESTSTTTTSTSTLPTSTSSSSTTATSTDESTTTPPTTTTLSTTVPSTSTVVTSSLPSTTIASTTVPSTTTVSTTTSSSTTVSTTVGSKISLSTLSTTATSSGNSELTTTFALPPVRNSTPALLSLTALPAVTTVVAKDSPHNITSSSIPFSQAEVSTEKENIRESADVTNSQKSANLESRSSSDVRSKAEISKRVVIDGEVEPERRERSNIVAKLLGKFQSAISRTPESDSREALLKRNCPPDSDPSCAFWAALDECRKNPLYMHRVCGRACEICGDISAKSVDGSEIRVN